MAAVSPYFAGPRSTMAGPRLLLVTYSFPPDRSVGALRWEQLSAYLGAHGWQVDVVTLDPANLDFTDPARAAALPATVRAFGVPHRPLVLERAQAHVLAVRRRLLARRNPVADSGASAANGPGGGHKPAAAPTDTALVPVGGGPGRRAFAATWASYLARVQDASYRRWARNAARLGAALVREGEHAAVVTSGPPHMAHVAGRLVAERTRIPLVTDFRDPWSHNSAGRPDRSPTVERLARAHERRVIAAARLVVLNTEAARAQLAAAYPAAASRMLTVMNGADGRPTPSPARGTRFTIAFAGSIYIDRDPEPLFRALRRVVDTLGLTPADIGIDMIGNVHAYRGTSTQALAERAGVGAFVTLGGSVPRDEALAFQARAHMLVSLPQASLTQIPAKTFEYVNFSAWLLVFAPPESETALVLRGTEAHVVGLDDVEGAAAAIQHRYVEWRDGGNPVALNADGRFGREAQARRLLDALHAIAAPGAKPGSAAAALPPGELPERARDTRGRAVGAVGGGDDPRQDDGTVRVRSR